MGTNTKLSCFYQQEQAVDKRVASTGQEVDYLDLQPDFRF
jgi:hypothetical protein